MFRTTIAKSLLIASVLFFTAISGSHAEDLPSLVKCKGAVAQRTYDAAIAACTEAIDDGHSDREKAIALNVRAIVYIFKRDAKSALSDLNASIALDTTDGAVYSDRGALFYSLGTYDRAIADYNEALRHIPSDGNIYVNRGWAYLARGDYAPALADFERAGTMLPDEPQQWMGQAGALFALGRYEQAAQIYRNVKRRWLNADLYIWMLVAELRAGDIRSDTAETAETYIEPDTWPRPVSDYLVGSLTAEELERAAAVQQPLEAGSSPDCQAAFYIGEMSLSVGKDKEAEARLRHATEICSRNTFERIIAQAELKRTEP